MAKESGLLCLCMSLMHNGWIEEGEGRKGDRGQKLPDQASQKVGGVLGFLLLSKSDYHSPDLPSANPDEPLLQPRSLRHEFLNHLLDS